MEDEYASLKARPDFDYNNLKLIKDLRYEVILDKT
jgi:hypothetical protein